MRYQEHLLDLQNRELKHDADGVVWEEADPLVAVTSVRVTWA
jgi:hypothetical protein